MVLRLFILLVHGHLIARYLIREKKCDPSCESKFGGTPLHFACKGHLNIAQYLIKETNCIASCENNNGVTPLHLLVSMVTLTLPGTLLAGKSVARVTVEGAARDCTRATDFPRSLMSVNARVV